MSWPTDSTRAQLGDWLKLTTLLVPYGAVFAGGFALTVLQSLGMFLPVAVDGGPLAAYLKLFGDAWFWKSSAFSLYVAFTSTTIAMVAGTLLAYAMWKLPLRWQKATIVYKIPLVLPHIAVAFIVLLFFSQSGFVASLCHRLGLIDGLDQFPPLLFTGNGIGLILAYVYKEAPFVILMVFAALRKLDPRLLQTAEMLGASRLRIFSAVVLPFLRPALHATYIILFLYSFGAFDIPFLLSESYPGMLSIQVYNLYFKRDLVQRPHAMAILVMMFVFSIVFVVLYTRIVAHLDPRERKL